jgi:hypothetical protein
MSLFESFDGLNERCAAENSFRDSAVKHSLCAHKCKEINAKIATSVALIIPKVGSEHRIQNFACFKLILEEMNY